MWTSKWIWIAAFAWMIPSEVTTEPNNEWRKPAARFVQQLEAANGEAPIARWNAEAGTPGLLAGQLSKPSGHSPAWIAFEFLEQAKGAYDLKRVNESMKITRIAHEKSGAAIVYLQRYLFGKPVCGNELLMEIDRAGVIRRVEGTIHADLVRKRLNRPMIPAISEKEAVAEASRFTKRALAPEAADVRACYLPNREGVPLVYFVSFERAPGAAPIRPIVVHSLTGRVIDG